MSARVVLAVTVALAAGPAWSAEKVTSEKVAPATKVSSSSSSGESRAAARSAGPRSSSAAERRSPGRGRGSYVRPPETDAQRRQPRPGTGTGRFRDGYRDRDGRFNFGYSHGYGYRPRYRYPSYGFYHRPWGYGYGYSPYYYSGYYGYEPSYYRRGRGYGYYRDNGSLRIIVEPVKTRVYVDGYYAGVVDDFDGILQRLNVPPGRHDITLRLEGYRTQHFRVYVPVDQTIKIHYDMVRGSGEATSDQFMSRPDADYARIEDRGSEDEDRWRDDRRYDDRDADTGTVRIQVRPGDASVYVDGEFRGSGRSSGTLRLREGRHRIEVVRPGYRTLEREIDVRAGRTTDVDFDLERM